jgi:predicted kinase
MSKLYMMVGVPGCGKTTWIKNQLWTNDCVVVSTDFFVEQHALSVGSSYGEVFESYMPTAVRLMTEQVVRAREDGRDIIWDQTSTTVATRKKKLNMLPNYHAIAVVFDRPPAQELMRRLASRPGKIIPWDVVTDMINKFEMPTEEEGFKEIWRVP